jgi:hypothetical protein
MHNKGIEFDEKSEVIIKKYNEVDLKRHYMINKNDEGNKVGNILFLYQDIRKQLLEVNDDSYYVTDVLVKQLYEVKQSKYKTTLWECFGDIIFDNIKNNISSSFKNKVIQCEKCGRLIEAKSNRTKYCTECWKEEQLKWQRESMRKIRQQSKCEVLEKV